MLIIQCIFCQHNRLSIKYNGLIVAYSSYVWLPWWLRYVKESVCNAADLGLIPGWEDPLEKGMATHFSILAWRFSWTEETGYGPGGCKVADMIKQLTHTHTHTHTILRFHSRSPQYSITTWHISSLVYLIFNIHHCLFLPWNQNWQQFFYI